MLWMQLPALTYTYFIACGENIRINSIKWKQLLQEMPVSIVWNIIRKLLKHGTIFIYKSFSNKYTKKRKKKIQFIHFGTSYTKRKVLSCNVLSNHVCLIENVLKINIIFSFSLSFVNLLLTLQS